MSGTRFSRKRKPRGAGVQSESNTSTVDNYHDEDTSARKDLGAADANVDVILRAPGTHFVSNYAGSVLFHAYIAFVPALLQLWLNNILFFRLWSCSALTLFTLFIANVSWMEIFDSGCITDACSALIGLTQEKQYRELCGSDMRTPRNLWWILGGISGLLGASTVGLLIALFSPLNPFSSVLPLPQQIFLDLQTDASVPSLLSDILKAVTPEDRRANIASSLNAVAHAAVNNFPEALAPVLYGLQHTLDSISPDELLRACSFLVDIFIAEFVCCFMFYMVTTFINSAAFYLEMRHVPRINFTVLLLAVASGFPYCRAVGGPMLGLSFSALVAGSRLDPWCFVLTASADLLAAACAVRIVRPVLVVPVGVHTQNLLKKNL